jgi:hypothetical protein
MTILQFMNCLQATAATNDVSSLIQAYLLTMLAPFHLRWSE